MEEYMNVPSSEKYPLPMRLMHWLVALIILTLLGVGLYMTELPKEDANRGLLYGLHKSFGVTVLLLFALRLALHDSARVPSYPAFMKWWEIRLSKGVNKFLYAAMVAMPLTGYIMSDGFGFGVKWFGMALPKLFETNRAAGELAGELHEAIAWMLIGAIALHLLGAIKHWLVDKSNILKRMW